MYLSQEPLCAEDFLSSAGDTRSGASVIFLGLVRRSSVGKQVLYLEYEAYEEMAERQLAAVVASAFERWPLERVLLRHRLGRVGLGAIAVGISVASAHREGAYLASRFLIESIKHDVAIWKKEFFLDGTSAWSSCAVHADVLASF